MNQAIRFTAACLTFFMVACNNAPSSSQLVAQGNRAYYEANYKAASQAYNEAKDIVPFAGEPVYNTANTFYRQGLYTETLESLSESLNLFIENVEGESHDELIQFTHYNMGNTHFSQQEWEATIEAYKKALRLDPDDMGAKYNLELALQHLKAESQEQEQQQDQQNEDQPDEQTQPEEQSAPEEQPQSNALPKEQQPQEGMSVEQARQLVETVGENVETLQERLQQIYVASNPPPDKDW